MRRKNTILFKGLMASLLAIIIIGIVLMLRKPVKISYAKDTKELIVSSGLFYTLDNHREYVLAIDKVLAPVSDSDSEYRFRCIPGSTAIQQLTVFYHDFTGKEGNAVFEVERVGGLDLFRVTQLNGSIYCQFLCSSE